MSLAYTREKKNIYVFFYIPVYILHIYMCACMYAYAYIRTKIHNGGNYANAHV